MKDLQLFDFNGNQVRTVNNDGEIWFVATDVSKVLNLSNTTVALERLDDDERSKFNLGRQGEANIISEAGLYSFIGTSRKSEAKKFMRWVNHEVLPSIRKNGAYMTPEVIEKSLTDPDFIISLATQLKSEREGRLIAEQQVNELKPKASYYDKVLSNNALVTTTAIAKDYGMSAREMNGLLHRLKVQFKQGSTWFLYAKYQRNGWTQSETQMVRRKDGTEKAVLNTKWTQKGRLGLYELLKLNGALPTIEQQQTA